MNLLKICIILFLFFTCYSFSNNDFIIGKWEVSSKDAIIKIYKYKGKYYGKLEWFLPSDDPDKNLEFDRNNPDPKKRKRLIKDINIMGDFKFEDGRWVEGYVYDARSGETYSCVIDKISETEIKIKGYIFFEFIGKSDVWRKLE